MSAFPSVDLSNLDAGPTARQARDAGEAVTAAAVEATKEVAYTAIGLGVLTFQRLQVKRREIEKTLRS